jgi:hypothetical protein
MEASRFAGEKEKAALGTLAVTVTFAYPERNPPRPSLILTPT